MPVSIPILNLVYLAGYFDGEGSICFTNRKAPQLKAKIKSGDEEVLLLFSGCFGGSVFPVKARRAHRQIYEWCVTNTQAQEVITTLLPYLRAKRYVAELALQATFQKRTESRRITINEMIQRKNLAMLISSFNNRETVLPEYRA